MKKRRKLCIRFRFGWLRKKVAKVGASRLGTHEAFYYFYFCATHLLFNFLIMVLVTDRSGGMVFLNITNLLVVLLCLLQGL